MHSESEGDPYLDRPDTRLYWHPRVELALWVVDWTLVVLCYALVWQCLAAPGLLNSGGFKEDIYIAIGVRAVWIIAALAFLYVASIIVESWYMIAVQRVRAEYAYPRRVVIMAILSVPFLIVITIYLYFAAWGSKESGLISFYLEFSSILILPQSRLIFPGRKRCCGSVLLLFSVAPCCRYSVFLFAQSFRTMRPRSVFIDSGDRSRVC